MLGLIISLIIVGLIAGALARLLVPGRDSIGVPGTILLGVVGSFVGGFLGYVLFHNDGDDGFFQASGVIGSVIGAVITLLVYRRNAERRPHLERDRCFECKRFIATGAIGRCDGCFERRPSALALQVGKHRVEYVQEMLDALPAAQRSAVERSPNRIR